ncbi:tRNA 2-selenouridine(34) synthase MnmH [Bacillus tianshenii]|nr:tRNA 2-selenouridine(34) synthase MnmH [Bacillus tianshenii]
MGLERDVQEYIKNRDKYLPIDVRSQGEFQESALPQAVNVPLFNNTERAEIGTIYKQIGQDEAKWRAMEIVSPKLPGLLSEVKSLGASSGKTPLLYCWRGGMRSRSMTHFAELAGLKVERLNGGYRAFRNAILAEIPKLLQKKAVVLSGMTGTKKTVVLKELQKRGYPVLDLEAMAEHKGSLFGAIDGRTPANQKTFDARLFEALDEIKDSPYFIMEGESKRIGHCVLPEVLLERKQNGITIHIEASLHSRIKQIYEDYVVPNQQDPAFRTRLEAILPIIRKRIKNHQVKAEIEEAFAKRDYYTFIEYLLIHYYDPRYQHHAVPVTSGSYVVNSEQIESAVEQIEQLIREIVQPACKKR